MKSLTAISCKVFIANLVFTIPQLFQSQQAPYVHGIRKRFTGLVTARNKLGYTGMYRTFDILDQNISTDKLF